jgi:hypothetical protein
VSEEVVEAIQDGATKRATGGAGGGAGVHSVAMVVVIACALFTDFFLYGIFFPLAPRSPANLQDEDQFAFRNDSVGARGTI